MAKKPETIDCVEVKRRAQRKLAKALAGKTPEEQVELAELSDGPLYLLLDMMREGIRQFLTFEQQLDARDPSRRPREPHRRAREAQPLYFARRASRPAK